MPKKSKKKSSKKSSKKKTTRKSTFAKDHWRVASGNCLNKKGVPGWRWRNGGPCSTSKAALEKVRSVSLGVASTSNAPSLITTILDTVLPSAPSNPYDYHYNPPAQASPYDYHYNQPAPDDYMSKRLGYKLKQRGTGNPYDAHYGAKQPYDYLSNRPGYRADNPYDSHYNQPAPHDYMSNRPGYSHDNVGFAPIFSDFTNAPEIRPVGVVPPVENPYNLPPPPSRNPFKQGRRFDPPIDYGNIFQNPKRRPRVKRSEGQV
jgi:hypothetical protein